MQSKHGSLECAILNALWNLELDETYSHTVKDVFNYMNENADEARAYTTIKTVLDRLHEKRLVLRYKQEKKFVYRTVQSRFDLLSDSLKMLASRYCNGNLDQLVLTLKSMITAQSQEPDKEYEMIV